MKKMFLMAMLATGALAMSSCSNEDDLASSGQVSTLDPNVVAFSTNGQKGMTRSGGTVTSLTTFNVWSSTADGNAYIGALDGSGETFTYDALSEVFKSDVNHYWPSVGTLNFFASNEFTEMSGYTVGSPDEAFVNYTNDGSKDIVCATVRTGTKTIPYPLLFHHVLSQVKVTAEAKDKTQDLQYRVVGITMTTQDLGRYYYATSTGGIGTWVPAVGSTRAYAFGANMPAVFEKDGSFASTDYWNVLPCVNDIVFNIQYQVIQNGVVISDFTGANAKTVTVSSPGLLSEKKYTYNFKLGIDNDDVITFTTTVNAWEDASADSYIPDYSVPYLSVSAAEGEGAFSSLELVNDNKLGSHFEYRSQYIENLIMRIYTSEIDLTNIDYSKFSFYKGVYGTPYTWTLVPANQYDTYFDYSEYPIEDVVDGALNLPWNSNYTNGCDAAWKICYDGKEICIVNIVDWQDP